MPFSSLSKDALLSGNIVVDNLFITNYMPNADEIAVKVYLYGLYLCAQQTSLDNSAQNACLTLGVEKKQLLDAIKYWEDLGLIRITKENPLEIEYVPIKSAAAKPRKYNANKYSDFVSQVENSILSRALTPNELIKFVEVVEDYKITTDALLLIVQYCVRTKGESIHTNYILTVAKAWANEGIKTAAQVDNKLKELEAQTEDMRQVFYALGLKSAPDFEDKQCYIKWTGSWGYTLECVLFAAKLCKKRGGMKKLDSVLDGFYKLGLFTLDDIKKQSEYIEYTRNLAININKQLGVFYENIDSVVELYITDWLSKGYDANGLKAIATYCMRRNIKSLEGMNTLIGELYKEGVVTTASLNAYFDKIKRNDDEIQKILRILGTSRMVTNTDRDYYKTWTDVWGLSDQIIEYAASKSVGKSFSLAYLGSLLSVYKENNVQTVADCEKIATNPPKIGGNSNNSQIISDKHIYSKEELDNLFNKEDESSFDF